MLYFYAWVVLLLAITLSVPVVNFLENKKRRAAQAAKQPVASDDMGMGDDGMGGDDMGMGGDSMGDDAMNLDDGMSFDDGTGGFDDGTGGFDDDFLDAPAGRN